LCSLAFVLKHKSYVVKGAFRGYLVDNEGKEHTLSFARRLVDFRLQQFPTYQEPATLFVEFEDSVSDSDCYKTNSDFKRNSKLEKFERIITQRSLAFQQKTLYLILSKRQRNAMTNL